MSPALAGGGSGGPGASGVPRCPGRRAGSSWGRTPDGLAQSLALSPRVSTRQSFSKNQPVCRLSLVFEYGRLRGPVEAQHAVSYDVVSTMRICVPSGSVAWVQTWWPRRLRVHASVCLELRGAPLATAREVWGLRSAAWWASVDLTYHVVRPTTLSVRDQRRAAPCTPITCLFCRSSNRS